MSTFGIRILALGGSLAAAGLMSAATLAEGELGGSRYYYISYYAGEISAAKAFMDGVLQDPRFTDEADRLTIIDVRDASEYRRGHPDGAVHIPYPRIYRECKPNPDDPADPILRAVDGGACLYGSVSGSEVGMTPEDFFHAVEMRYPDKSERLALLCRTGSRSVRGGNILANPAEMLCEDGDDVCKAGYAERGYTAIYNIWQGFVGQPLVPISTSGRALGPVPADVTEVTLDDGSAGAAFVPFELDLNYDDVIGDDDLDGWRNHQGLPYTDQMRPRLLNRDALPFYWRP